MLAPKSIWSLFDERSALLVKQMDFLTLSLDGALERYFKRYPSSVGLRQFMEVTKDLVDQADQMTAILLDAYTADAETFLMRQADGTPFPVVSDTGSRNASQTLSIARQTLQRHYDVLRLLYGRRFRSMLVTQRSLAGYSPQTVARVLSRAGRSIRSEDLVYLTARKAMIDWFNESQIEILNLLGEPRAGVIAQNSEHEFDGRTISLNEGDTTSSTYPEIVDIWFHPRCRIVIGRVA